MKAMILAAGLGTRLKPFTDNHPKALAIVNGKTLLQHAIEYLSSFGINEIMVNVHHFPEQIEEALNKYKGFGSDVTISDERGQLLETGGGLMKASWFFEKETDPFVLMNVDILTDLDLGKMIEQHQFKKTVATLAVTSRETNRYFLFDDKDQLCGWRNIKTNEEKISRSTNEYHQKAFSGIHVLSPEIFSMIHQRGKFSLVDTYLDIAKTHVIKSFDHSDSKFIDVGKPGSIEAAEKMFSSKR